MIHEDSPSTSPTPRRAAQVLGKLNDDVVCHGPAQARGINQARGRLRVCGKSLTAVASALMLVRVTEKCWSVVRLWSFRVSCSGGPLLRLNRGGCACGETSHHVSPPTVIAAMLVAASVAVSPGANAAPRATRAEPVVLKFSAGVPRRGVLDLPVPVTILVGQGV